MATAAVPEPAFSTAGLGSVVVPPDCVKLETCSVPVVRVMVPELVRAARTLSPRPLRVSVPEFVFKVLSALADPLPISPARPPSVMFAALVVMTAPTLMVPFVAL